MRSTSVSTRNCTNVSVKPWPTWKAINGNSRRCCSRVRRNMKHSTRIHRRPYNMTWRWRIRSLKTSGHPYLNSRKRMNAYHIVVTSWRGWSRIRPIRYKTYRMSWSATKTSIRIWSCSCRRRRISSIRGSSRSRTSGWRMYIYKTSRRCTITESTPSRMKGNLSPNTLRIWMFINIYL